MPRKFLKYLRSVLITGAFLLQAQAAYTQTYNRFQYHRYRWQSLHTEAFHLYFPEGCDSLASFASVHLPDLLEVAYRAMGTRLKTPSAILIYPSADQLYESNVGLNEPGIQSFPTISKKGNRLLVAFRGSYEDFRQQLARACVKAAWERLFPPNLESQASSRESLSPGWYREGNIRYFSGGWPAAREAALHGILREDPPGSWTALLARHPVLAGQAFCYFLDQNYRQDACKQTLFQLREGKSLERALRLVTKRPMDTLTGQCLQYYRQRAAAAAGKRKRDSLLYELEELYPREALSGLQRSRDQQWIAYISEKHNRRTVYLQGLPLRAKHRIRLDRYVLPPWIGNHEADPYPLLHWDEQGSLLLALPEKAHIRVKRFDTRGKAGAYRNLYSLDGISAFGILDAGRWLLSAFRKGKSDILLYDSRRLSYTPLTGGMAEHTEFSLGRGGDGTPNLVYRSGYPADSLYHRDTGAKAYGIYLKRLPVPGEGAGEPETLLLADSAYISWHDPAMLPGPRLALTGTTGGMPQRDTFLLNGQLPAAPRKRLSPWLKDYLQRRRTADSIARLEQAVRDQDVPLLAAILSPGSSPGQAELHRDSMRRALAYTPGKVHPYILQLHSAYFSAAINNDYYINRYQPFRAYLGTFKFPEIGAMARGGFSDLFDNHHFHIAYRMPAGTEGSDFFSRYENKARKTDWHLLFFRKVESLQPDPYRNWKDEAGRPYPQAAKVKTHYYELGFHRPLAYDLSLDFITAARNDRTIFLATDRYSLNFPDLEQWWNISSLSFSIRKLQPLSLPFLYRGWEARLLADGMIALEKPTTILYGLQLHSRYHLPLFGLLHMEAGLQAGYSGGASRVLYNFGGLDNNIVPRADTSVRFGQEAPYAFQTLVTPFRGYAQNSLYGSSYGMFNLDIYLPLFPNVIPLQTGFTALSRLQLGAFLDAATASGPGVRPANAESSLYAWGLSARTLLAGYPLRFDLAWPGAFQRQPVWYLSLSL